MPRKKLKTDLHTFGIQKNAPSLQIVDESKIPAEYWKPQEPKLDSRTLLKEVKANPEAFKDFVQLYQTESLRIR